MIIPKKDAKCYGAVHIDNYLTFIGFCKKVESDEVCDVDVFVDGKKVDTLKADKKIVKVEEIYDIENHGFLFELDEKYFERTHTLEFKASSGEELVNSKIQTIDKKHPKFNEYRFLNKLTYFNQFDTIKELYKKDSVGFLIVDENLHDKDFIGYIKKLYISFPQVRFKAFYFNENQLKIASEIFLNEIDRFQFIEPLNIYDIVDKIEVYINNLMNEKFTLLRDVFLFHENSLYTISFVQLNSNVKLNHVDLNFFTNTIKPYHDYDISKCDTREQFYNFDLVGLCLNNSLIKTSIKKYNLRLES